MEMKTPDAKQLYDRATNEPAGPVLHVRVLGRSRDLALDLLEIGANTPDQSILEAVARFMEVTPEQLRGTVIERHENGNMTLRPQAVFG